MKDKVFVLRDTRSNTGSNATFWKDGGGYTTNLLEAELFTRERAQSQHSCRETDIPLHIDDLMKLSRERVDLQYLPEPSTTGKAFVLQVSGEYDGNDIVFVAEHGNTFDFNEARIFTRDDAMGYCTINSGCVPFSYEAISALTRRSLALTQSQENALFDTYGFVRREPEPAPAKPRYNCCECGKFITLTDRYTSCSHCDAPNY